MQSICSLASLPFHCNEAQGFSVFLRKEGGCLKHIKLELFNTLLFTASFDSELHGPKHISQSRGSNFLLPCYVWSLAVGEHIAF